MAKKHPSALKRQRQDLRRRARNQAGKARVKTLVKKARDGALSGDPALAARLAEALKALDKAAGGGIIHRNAAARRKSRLARMAKKYAAPQAGS